MAALAGTVQAAPLFETGRLCVNSGTYTFGTAATGDVLTFANIFPELPTTRMAVQVFFDKGVDSNASPGTLIIGDSSDDNGYGLAQLMNKQSFGSSGALIGTTSTNRDLIITLGTIGTAVAGTVVSVNVFYFGGDTNPAVGAA